MTEFKNYNPGEEICPFCNGTALDPIQDWDIAAENDGAFWVDRECPSCKATWRDYYEPDRGAFYEVCPSCGSDDIEVDYGEIEYNVARSSGSCNDCGDSWINYYTYSFSSR